MKQLLFLAIACLFMTTIVSAQETKVKTKDAAGKETKVKKESDKVKIKGEEARKVTISEHAAMDMEQVKQQLMNLNKSFSQAVIKGDSAAMVNLYHSGAIIFPPNMAALSQRNEMGRMIAGMPAAGIKSMDLTTSEIFGSGDMLIETGTFQMGDGTKVVDKGKYMVIWKQENGQWKIYRDIWNSDMPMAGK